MAASAVVLHDRAVPARDARIGTRTVDAAHVNFFCPRCGYSGLKRSRPRWYDGIRIALTGSRPYRCLGCRTRRWWRPKQVLPPPR